MNTAVVKNVLRGLVSFAVLAYLFYLLDWDQIRSLPAVTFAFLALGVAFTLLQLAFMALRWHRLSAWTTAGTVLFRCTYKGYLLGLFFSLFLPGAIGGDVYRVEFGRKTWRTNMKTSALVILTERLFGLTALLIMGGVGVLLSARVSNALDWPPAALLMIAAGMIAALVALKLWINRKVGITLGRYCLLLILSALAHMTDVFLFLFFARLLSVGIGFADVLVIIPVVYVATVLPISLGGLGVREGTMAGLLALLGASASSAVIIALLHYLSKVGAGLIGSGVYLVSKGAPTAGEAASPTDAGK